MHTIRIVITSTATISLAFPRLEQETTNRVELEKRLQSDKRELQQCHIQMDEYVKEQKKLEERILQMDADVAAYQEQSESDRTKLEAEMVARVNAENNCQSLHEEISFNFTVHVKVRLQYSPTDAMFYQYYHTPGTYSC